MYRGEVNRVSTSAKSNTRFYPSKSLFYHDRIKIEYEILSYICSSTTVCLPSLLLTTHHNSKLVLMSRFTTVTLNYVYIMSPTKHLNDTFVSDSKDNVWFHKTYTSLQSRPHIIILHVVSSSVIIFFSE